MAAILHAERRVDRPARAPASRSVQLAGVAPAAKPAPARPGIVISERDRDAVYDYYGTKHAPGACPPGLVKQANGCLPGQARGAWAIGEPLHDNELSYPLPAVLLGQLSPPPDGYDYARIGEDVLVLGIETRIVAGALAGPDDN